MTAAKPMPLLAEAIVLADSRVPAGPDGLIWGLRAVHADLTSSRGFRYPWPDQWVDAHGPILDHTTACPQAVGDGLCAALTWAGMASGRIPALTLLLVGWAAADVLGADTGKVRVRRMFVRDVIDGAALLRGANLSGAYLLGANLSGANLFGANLSGANLSGANLSGANLSGADLSGANLSGASLLGANLSGAYLSGANLSGANLFGANLFGANLSGANLSGADLSDANLSGANLSGANLSDANLSGAYLFDANLSGAYLFGAVTSSRTIFPVGFDAAAAGVRS